MASSRHMEELSCEVYLFEKLFGSWKLHKSTVVLGWLTRNLASSLRWPTIRRWHNTAEDIVGAECRFRKFGEHDEGNSGCVYRGVRYNMGMLLETIRVLLEFRGNLSLRETPVEHFWRLIVLMFRSHYGEPPWNVPFKGLPQPGEDAKTFVLQYTPARRPGACPIGSVSSSAQYICELWVPTTYFRCRNLK